MIGVFGGTFDPVHCGHLRTALEVTQQLKLAFTLLIPNGSPPHRGAPIANAAQRLAMLAAALAQARDADPAFDALRVDDREVRRAGPSYMVDTLATLRAEVAHDEGIWLIIGADALSHIHRWHRWRQLLELANIAVMTRPGAPLTATLTGEVGDWVARGLEAGAEQGLPAAGAIRQLPVTQLDISASKIRRDIAAGRLPHFLTPSSVVERIVLERLYR